MLNDTVAIEIMIKIVGGWKLMRPNAELRKKMSFKASCGRYFL